MASRWAIAALAAGCPLGRSRQTARSSAKDVKFVIDDEFPCTGRPGGTFSKFVVVSPWPAPAASPLGATSTGVVSNAGRDCRQLGAENRTVWAAWSGPKLPAVQFDDGMTNR